MVEKIPQYGIESLTIQGTSKINKFDEQHLKGLAENTRDDSLAREYQYKTMMEKLKNETFYFDVETPPANSDTIREEFISAYLHITGEQDTQVHTAIKNHSKLDCTFENISLLLNTFDSIDKLRESEEISQGTTREQVRNWCYTPDTIKEFSTFNCSGAATMFASVATKLGREVYVANPNGHAVNIIKANNTVYYMDPRNTKDGGPILYDISKDIAYDYEGTRIGKIRLKKSIPGFGFTILPYYRSIQDAHNHMSAENHRAMADEDSDLYQQEKSGIELVKERTENFDVELKSFSGGTIRELDAYKESQERADEVEGLNHSDELIQSLNTFAKDIKKYDILSQILELEKEEIIEMLFLGRLPNGIKSDELETDLQTLQERIIGAKGINPQQVKVKIGDWLSGLI